MASINLRRTAGRQLTASSQPPPPTTSRHDFPPDFMFGAATSCYQIEGAYADGRKSLNDWDVITMTTPEMITDGKNGCVAIDHYFRYKDDIKLMKNLGIDCYRFSISWSRILPGGRLDRGVNDAGIKFYNNLIDQLLHEGITPFATIFHFDVPQCLVDEYGGFDSHRIVQDYAEYAQVCFFHFGDRVKYWVTMNEPLTLCKGGFDLEAFTPEVQQQRDALMAANPSINARVASLIVAHALPQSLDEIAGTSKNDGFLRGHNFLIAHATAVDIYKSHFQAVQHGKIGIVNQSQWFEPYRKGVQEDEEAAIRAVDFSWGWFTEPVVRGDYPAVMRERLGSLLPEFTPEEKKLLKGSFDFIGMNYYSTYLAENNPAPLPPNPTQDDFAGIISHYDYPDGTPIGKQAASPWLYIVPRGIYGLLKHNKTAYGNPTVYITENGISDKTERIPISQALRDDLRIQTYLDTFAYAKQAIDEGVDLRGFMVWSLFDNFEWLEGYTVRFGMFFVDYVNNLVRYPKKSAIWYMNFLNKNPPSTSKRDVLEDVEADNTASKKKRARN